MRYFEKDKDTVVIKFYGEVGTWWNNAKDFTTMFEDLDARYKNIDIRVHCYGGQVFEGNVIYNAILNAKANVTIYIDGVSASMSSIIMLAGSKVIAADNAIIMLHSPSGYTEGTAEAHYSTAKLLRSMEKTFGKRYAEKTGKSEAEVKGWFDGNDHWFSAEEAMNIGLIDEVIPAVVKNIKTLNKPDSNSDITVLYSRYAAHLKDAPKLSSNQNQNIMDKKLLIAKFQLAGVDENSSDTAIMEALEKKQKETTASGNTAADQAEAVIKTVETITGKLYAAEQRKTLLAIGASSGLTVMQETMKFMIPANNEPGGEQQPATPAAPAVVNTLISGSSANSGVTDRKNWSWDDYQEKDPAALEKMEGENWDAYSKLYQAKYNVLPKK